MVLTSNLPQNAAPTKPNRTPGPWRAVAGRGCAAVKAADCAIYINTRTVETDETVARWQADAEFICRAVNAHEDMRDALVLARKALIATAAPFGSPSCDCDTCAALAAIDAAIAKAEGRA